MLRSLAILCVGISCSAASAQVIFVPPPPQQSDDCPQTIAEQRLWMLSRSRWLGAWPFPLSRMQDLRVLDFGIDPQTGEPLSFRKADLMPPTPPPAEPPMESPLPYNPSRGMISITPHRPQSAGSPDGR